MGSKTVSLKVDVPGAVAVTLERAVVDGPHDVVFVYAPGAGSNIHDPFGVFVQDELAGHGYSSMRFQFPYQELRQGAPDRTPVLEATWHAALQVARKAGGRLVIGGRSMGGRIASHVVAKGAAVGGLALFAYPLQPPNQPGRTRDGHLPSIAVPTLFCSGTRDSFGTPEQLRAAAALVPGSTVHFLDGADHSFKVLKSSGCTQRDVYHEAADALVGFLSEL